MSISLADLVSAFGMKSDIAQDVIPKLYNELNETSPAYSIWKRNFAPKTINSSQTNRLAKYYDLSKHNPLLLLYTLQTYYVAVVTTIVKSRIHQADVPPSAKDNLKHFDQAHTTIDDVCLWQTNTHHLTAIQQITEQLDFSNPIPDALKTLYHDLFPSKLRHALGEYYTPDWFAHFVLDRIGFDSTQTVLDPTCGSGTFLVLAYRRLLDAGISNPLNYIAGIDINPLACLSAKANLILNIPNLQGDITLPIFQADVLLNPPDLGEFDLIVGNPPWINWETLPEGYRQQTKSLWEDYGLFPHSGFEAILGKGKKDLSLVLTYAVVNHYLKSNGNLAFIMTQSVLKTGGAAQGFRQFSFQKPIHPSHVDDFSKLRIFTGAETKPIVLVLSHDSPEQPTYHIWHRDKKTIRGTTSQAIIETLNHDKFIAEPIAEQGSAWLTGKPKALQAVRKIIGKSDYTAHANVYTGGANAVYWLDVLERDGDKARVQNVVKGSKRKVKQVEAWLEADLIFPLLRGRDVSRWQAEPSLHILIVQNPDTRQGYDEAWLAETYPLTFAYLKQFENTLKKRATYKRYFRDTVPFYTMFDIGEYTFCDYKVIWHGFGKKRMEAVVVSTQDSKPIMGNQAMHPFIGLNNADEAHYIAGCLNSAPFEFAVLSHTQSGGKSFAQPGILNLLRVPLYDAQDSAHQQLVTLSREAHEGKIDDDAIAEASAGVWGLSTSELHELQDSLSALLS